MKRTIAKPAQRLGGLSLAGLMLLSGCGAQTPTAAPQSAEPTTATQATAPTEAPKPTDAPAAAPVTLRVTMWESNEALEPYNKAKAMFESANPNIKVQLEPVPQEYGTKLLVQIAAGTAPDVFQLGDGDVSKFVKQGVVEPLDDYIKRDNFDMSVFFPDIAKIGQLEGKTYLLTKDYSPLVLFYNKALFEKAGVAPPSADWTWQDFLETAKKLTVTDGDKVTQWGAQVPNSWGDPTWLRGTAPFIYQNGADILSPDGQKATGYLNSPETIEAVQFFTDLITKHKVSPSKADVAALQGQDLFQTGKVAMLIKPLEMSPEGMLVSVANMKQGDKHEREEAHAGADHRKAADSRYRAGKWSDTGTSSGQDRSQRIDAGTVARTLRRNEG
jgi:multiple sugar transport system substrate-binding protein